MQLEYAAKDLNTNCEALHASNGPINLATRMEDREGWSILFDIETRCEM